MKRTISNMEEINKIHFIGIGGIGMSGLARLFKHEGKEVGDEGTSVISKYEIFI